ncbi:MAG: response regulator transcription factor [Bacteroidetes bacterium]|nr:response regulator transcription factor [Bacteroidota bacterium]
MEPNISHIQILYVEDDETLAFVTIDNLSRKGYNITHCRDGLEAIKTFQSNKFDLCILDIMLPQIDGYAVAQIIRNTNQNIPIIFLSAKSTIEDKLMALRNGGDDFLHKPFSMNELIMRIQVFLRRSGEKKKLSEPTSEDLSIGDYKFNPVLRQITFNQKTETLSNGESKLLYLLATNINNIVYKEDIRAQNEINGRFSSKSLNTNISKLRKALEANPKITIENVREIGFRLRVAE